MSRSEGIEPATSCLTGGPSPAATQRSKCRNLQNIESFVLTSSFLIYKSLITGYPKGPAVTAVVSAYLSLGSYNVVLLNWEKLAGIALPSIIQSYIHWAVPNAMQVVSHILTVFATELSNYPVWADSQ